jgi:internalin A
VCKQVKNNNVYDASPSEQALYTELKRQYYLEGCERLWLYISKQETLVLQGLGVNDFRMLSNLETVVYLNLKDNHVSKAEFLPKIPQLRYLNLEKNKLLSLDKMPEYPNLHTLVLGQNNITNIDAVRQMPRLQFIDLSSNEITDMWPVAGLEEIRALHVSNNSVSNILPILYLPKVVSLSLHNNPVRFCPRGTWTIINRKKIDISPFFQHYCIHLRRQEAQNMLSFKGVDDE